MAVDPGTTGLQRLLAEATPDWAVRRHDNGTARIIGGQPDAPTLVADVYHENDRELFALAPDAVALLIDMAGWIGGPGRAWAQAIVDELNSSVAMHDVNGADALLARYAALEERT